jgi:hypothetical protein
MIFQEFSSQILTNLDFQKNFYFDLFSQNQTVLRFTYSFCIFLVNILSYSYVFIKFYRVMCYSRMTFEWFPLINPYKWPFSWFETFTQSYFDFWANLFPNIRFENSSVDVSSIIALEGLNSVLYFCVRLTQILIVFLEELEKYVNTNSLI